MIAVILFELAYVFGPGFSNQDSVVLVGDLSQVAENDVHLGQLGVVNLCLGSDRRICSGREGSGLSRFCGSSNRVSTASRRKPATPRLIPPASDVEHRVLHERIVPVQIRLLRIEIVIIKLSGVCIERPRRAAEYLISNCSEAVPDLYRRATYTSRVWPRCATSGNR